MDLAKYVSMLDSRALHFARADQMTDAWEGGYGSANKELRPTLYGEHHERMARHFPAMREAGRTQIYMNCWHVAEDESAAMWSIYQREGKGVAVRSTWAALTSGITAEGDVCGAKVRYIDYANEFVSEGNIFDRFLVKRRNFVHEKEARLLVRDTGQVVPVDAWIEPAAGTGPPVIPVSADLRSVVSVVYVAPSEPAWFRGVVESVTRHYGFDFDVRPSSMDTEPDD
jgi:hypothetical protein